jgi:hypothetical protein
MHRLVCDEVGRDPIDVDAVSVEPSLDTRPNPAADVVVDQLSVGGIDIDVENAQLTVFERGLQYAAVEEFGQFAEAHPGLVVGEPAVLEFRTDPFQFVVVDDARDLAPRTPTVSPTPSIIRMFHTGEWGKIPVKSFGRTTSECRPLCE